MSLRLDKSLLKGKNVIKVKRDNGDLYLWALTDQNEVYRVYGYDYSVVNYTPEFSAYSHLKFIDIQGISKDTVFVATDSDKLLMLSGNNLAVKDKNNGIPGTINGLGKSGSYWQNGLVISTDKGLCYYYYDTETFRMDARGNYKARIFESSYRNFMINDTFDYGVNTGADYYGISMYTENRGQVGKPLYLNDYLGHKLRTAYYTGANNTYRYTDLYNYWATEKGLVIKNRYSDVDGPKDLPIYLKDKQINKISSVLSLFGFRSVVNDIEKENLLIGADDGLYYTQSINTLTTLPTGGLNYHFTKIDELDGVKVNDISVHNEVDKRSSTYCEGGIWVAAENGLHFVRPMWQEYLNTHTADIIRFGNQDAALSETQLCGSSVKILVKGYTDGFIQWFKGGNIVRPNNDRELTIDEPGDYHAILYDNCSVGVMKTNHLKVKAGTSPIFSFKYDAEIIHCDNSPLKLTIESNEVYTYRWYKNGMLTGDVGNELLVTSGGKYKAEVSSCPGQWVQTKEVRVAWSNLPVPVISADAGPHCTGKPVRLSLNIPASSEYRIHWYLNGVERSNWADEKEIDVNVAGKYAVTLTNNTTCRQSSAGYDVLFDADPEITIRQSVNTLLCSGSTVTLTAEGSAGNLIWSTGEITPSITVDKPGTYGVILTTAAGCTHSDQKKVDFLPNPQLNLADATLCPFNNEQITINAPEGFAKYLWNGVPGTSQYNTTSTGQIKLEVEDINGCKAEQTVNVTTKCDDINIPNTFTPNGDGINDTWTITGITGDQSVTVKVFNRNGQQIFESKGYSVPWNGAYKGSPVASGVYYYIISTTKKRQLISGSLNILR